MSNLDRVCMHLRQTTETDDAGIKHRMMTRCRALLKPGQIVCDRCDDEIARREEAAMSMEIQR